MASLTSAARALTEVLFTLIPSETLAAEPNLTIQGPGQLDLTLVPGSRYTFRHVASADDMDGSYTIVASLTDLAGNTAGALPCGTVVLDFTAPTAEGTPLVQPARAARAAAEHRRGSHGRR